jgi:hypothetical protein
MAVDIAGDVAITLFARRGVGWIWKETHVLALRDGEWTWLVAPSNSANCAQTSQHGYRTTTSDGCISRTAFVS